MVATMGKIGSVAAHEGVAVPAEPITEHVPRTAPAQCAIAVALPDHTVVYPLPRRGQVTIGRAASADLSVDHRALSRRHAVLHVDGEIAIEDAGSTNGTTVYGRTLAPGERCPLSVGDAVGLGSITMMVFAWHGGPIDGGSALWSTAAFTARLDYECARAQRVSSPLAVLSLRLRGESRVDLEPVLLAVLGDCQPISVTADAYAVLLVGADAEEPVTAGLVDRLVDRVRAASPGADLEVGAARYPADGRSPSELLACARHLGAGVVRHLGAARPIVVAEPSMIRLHLLAERAASSTASVLLLGETGAGKEILAETIHRASSRRDQPLLRLNCAALSEPLLESELFGHERGSFSGAVQAKPGLLETADGGTVFLDEVGELPLPLQAKLLRVLEDGEVLRVGGLKSRRIDVRFIAATNRNLQEASRVGAFRSDLYYRLNGISLVIPPLRERRTEIAALAARFVDDLARRQDQHPPRLSIDAVAALEAYTWPGNVRELRNVIQRALIVCGNRREIGRDHLGLDEETAQHEPPPALLVADDERTRIAEALRRCAGNQSRAAKLLGVSRSTLIRRMLEYGLRDREWFAT